MNKISIIISIIIPLIIINGCTAQSLNEDIYILKSNENKIIIKDNNFRGSYLRNNKDVITFKHKNFISRYNPLSLLALSAMYIYQHIVSPQLFRHCLYELTCSNFSKAAINEFGLIKGVFLTADRLLRCNTDAVYDIPAEDFDIDGFAIDEPSKYRHCK